VFLSGYIQPASNVKIGGEISPEVPEEKIAIEKFDEIGKDLKDVPIFGGMKRIRSNVTTHDIYVADIADEGRSIYTGKAYHFNFGYIANETDYHTLITHYRKNFSEWKVTNVEERAGKLSPFLLLLASVLAIAGIGPQNYTVITYEKCENIYCPELEITIYHSIPTIVEIYCKKQEFDIQNMTYLHQKYGSLIPSNETIVANENSCLT
ncbi:MAG: hypothetical protein QW097_00350, partial [archaeon]